MRPRKWRPTLTRRLRAHQRGRADRPDARREPRPASRPPPDRLQPRPGSPPASPTEMIRGVPPPRAGTEDRPEVGGTPEPAPGGHRGAPSPGNRPELILMDIKLLNLMRHSPRGIGSGRAHVAF